MANTRCRAGTIHGVHCPKIWGFDNCVKVNKTRRSLARLGVTNIKRQKPRPVAGGSYEKS